MALNSGTRLGPYEIIAPIGAGGMGEVYRARDTKLSRDVAIKVLPAAFADDRERLARFTREAQTLAALNHPNIAQIYGIEESSTTRALVMELVDGDDLSALIARGLIPLAEVLPIARQIAEALEAAHDHGIIHRDLKPANIKVRADGTVKVLDFGLAKAMQPAGASASADAMNSPTITSPAITEMGMILGTAAYMAPEQARGKPIDKRADIWAFGVVVYEMLTRERAFKGEAVSDVLAAVLRQDIDWTALPAHTPTRMRRLLERCLDRDVKERLRDIGEARVELAKIQSGAPDSVNGAVSAGETHSAVWRRAVPWAIAATLAIALVALSISSLSRPRDRDPLPPVHASIDAPPGYVLGEDDSLVGLPTRTPMVFTPDGRSLIIQAASDGKPQLFLRSLDNPEARPIAGTDGARVPFVSPDGKWIGFFAANEIRKVPIEGGTPTTICALRSALGPNGAAWGTGDVIVFGDDRSGRILRVSAGGGTPVTATTEVPRLRKHVAPFLLPDGSRFLFSEVSTTDARDAQLMVTSLNRDEAEPSDARLVMASATDGRLLPSGQLGFMRLGTLMTVPFDHARAETTGDAVSAMGGVMQSGLRVRAGANNTGAGMYAVSSLGALAVIRGPVTGGEGAPLIWVTQDGQASPAEPTAGAPEGSRIYTRISPDQSRAVTTVITSTRRELWFVDWSRNLWTRCDRCSTVTAISKAWSPDGRRVLFGRDDTLIAHAIDGSVPDQELVREVGFVLEPGDWLADGRITYLSYALQSQEYEIKVLEPGSRVGRVVVPLGVGVDPAGSPDGRWLAYSSSAPGQPTNVVVQAFPGPGPRIQVSAGGGHDPAWSADSRTVYYMKSDAGVGVVVAVDIATTGTLLAGTPRELFRGRSSSCNPTRCYDISPTGPRFLFNGRIDGGATTRLSVTRMDLVLNWTATLGRK